MRRPYLTVLRYRDGRARRGTMRFFFHVQDHVAFSPEGGGSESVLLADLKSIVFLDPEGSSGAAARDRMPTGGRVLRVQFHDGEVLRGWVREYSPREKGFFLRPIGAGVEGRMVFVSRSALASVTPEEA